MPRRRPTLARRAGALLTTALIAGGLSVVTATPVHADDHDHDHDHGPGQGHVAGAYTLELLNPTNDGVRAAALGINDHGDVVGISRPTASAQPQFTVLWERHGNHFHAHQLANLEGSAFSRGFDLNNDQEIVGEAFNSGGNSIPVRWSGDAAPQHVDDLNEVGTGILNDIADDGVAVGVASSQGVTVADDGTVSVLPAPDPSDVGGDSVNNYTATSVADGGVVGGRASIAIPHGDHHHNRLFGVVWDADGPRFLQTPAGASSPVIAEVTAAGEAAGSVTLASKETAVVWEESGDAATLPTPEISTYTHAAAKAVAGGVVVGYASQFAGNTSFGGAAVAWGDDGPVDLNETVVDLPENVVLQSASDINEAGQIVGTATVAGDARGFVLTPAEVTEPEQVLSLSALSHHYHSGSPIALTLTVDPEPEAGDELLWEWRWPGTDDWVPMPGVVDNTWQTTAEQALHDVAIRVRLVYADPDREPVVSQPRTIDVDDHGSPAQQQVSVAGTTDVAAGDPVTLTASVAPATVLSTFRWERRGAGDDDFEVVAGETGAELSFTAAAIDDQAEYRAAAMLPNGDVAYGPSGAVTLSVAAEETVPPPTASPKVPVRVEAGPRTRTTKAGRPVVRAGGKARRGQIRLRLTADGVTDFGRVRVRMAGTKGLLRARVTRNGQLVIRVPKRAKPGVRRLVVRFQGSDETRPTRHRMKVRVLR